MTPASATVPRSVKRLSAITMFLLGGACAGAGVYWLSGDWACSAIGAALLASLATPFTDWVIQKISDRASRTRPAMRRWSRRHQIILLAISTIAFTTSAWVMARLDGPRLFEAATGIPLPPSVTDLRVERHYAGGPGDMICLMRFHADRQTLDGIIAGRHMTPSEYLEPYVKGQMDWPTFVRLTLGMAAHVNPAWGRLPPIGRPECYEWFQDASGPIQSVRLLWNPASNETYLMYLSG